LKTLVLDGDRKINFSYFRGEKSNKSLEIIYFFVFLPSDFY
jgi:hypothetical protein